MNINVFHKPRIDDELLGELNGGLFATSACLGSRSSQLILNGRAKEAEYLLDKHAAIFEDRFFIELQLHEDKEQQQVNQVLLDIAKRKNLPLLLTADCHYTLQEDKLIHEQALCIQTNDVMSNPNRFSFGDIDVHVANHDWMAERAAKQGIPYEAIKNTSYVAKQIDHTSYFSEIRNMYPTFKDMPAGMTSDQALERLAKTSLYKLMKGNVPEEYKTRLEYELKIIKKMGFSDYILIDWDLIKGARNKGVMVGPGRGSAAGSLVSYAIGITQVDPIKWNLLFDRFLNYGRAGQPMIFKEEFRKEVTEKKKTHECNHNHGQSILSQYRNKKI